MDLVKLAVKRKDINKETNSLLKERRILAERYKFNYDRYESIQDNIDSTATDLKKLLDNMKFRAHEITRLIDRNNKAVKLINIEMGQYK